MQDIRKAPYGCFFQLVVCLADEQNFRILMAAREFASFITDSNILLLFRALLSAFFLAV
jgi:hypothetical protein